MTLREALQTLNSAVGPGAATRRFFLACGFTSLHLGTFLQANLRLRFPSEKIDLETGLFGDLAGNIERASVRAVDSTAAVLEWADLDPRLSIRQLGGWDSRAIQGILECTAVSLERLHSTLALLARYCPVAVALPTLPLLPLDTPAGWQAGSFESELWRLVASFAAQISGVAGMRLLNRQRLDERSQMGRRFDAGSELAAGFPYTLEHASALAEMLSSLMHSPAPKKGLITDLDGTCWKGVLGEIGPERICWDMTGNAQMHGLYQQFLQALAERGTLIAVASKNDPALVEKAFRRPDMRLGCNSVFPFEAHWNAKSESVSRILKAWNIGPGDVVFVDDSAMELAEVQLAHPGLHCLQFPTDPPVVLELFGSLRDLFGKSNLSAEDRIRTESVRRAAVFQVPQGGDGVSLETVLRQAAAKIRFRVEKSTGDARAFELVNKTNQFNLNGRRYRESEWRSACEGDGAVLITASYEDRFGPLGVVSVVLGHVLPRGPLQIDGWVMSCRAFSRRIEYQFLRYLFQRFQPNEIVFDWAETPRNGPFCEFLSRFGSPQQAFRLTRSCFDEHCPQLFHSVEDCK